VTVISQPVLQHARRVADAMAGLPGFVGMTLGGSVASGLADESSDIDLHVYWRAPLASAAQREERLRHVADQGSMTIGVTSWGLEDHLRVGGQPIELVYVNLDDLRGEIERAYAEGLNGEGFVTAQFYYLDSGHVLCDPSGEMTMLQERLHASYPEPTRRLLLRDNPFLLQTYLEHLRKAQRRGDLLFVQHRRYSVQMVFFNLLFALNRRYHPGEKRLLIHGERCPVKPDDLAPRWEHVARMAADDPALTKELERLIEDICALAEEHR
jgi:hypothetical protein